MDSISLVRGFLKVSWVSLDALGRILIGLIGCGALKTNQTGMRQNILILQPKCYMQFERLKDHQGTRPCSAGAGWN